MSFGVIQHLGTITLTLKWTLCGSPQFTYHVERETGTAQVGCMRNVLTGAACSQCVSLQEPEAMDQ